MKTTNTIRIIMIVLFSIVIIAAGFMIVKETIYMKGLSSDILIVREEIAEKNLLLRQMKEAEKSSDLIRQRYEALQAMIPSEPLREQALLDIQKKAEAATVSLENVEFLKQLKTDHYTEMPINILVRGTYTGFLNLLTNLMYDHRLMRIDEIDIGNTEVGLLINLKVNYFYDNKK